MKYLCESCGKETDNTFHRDAFTINCGWWEHRYEDRKYHLCNSCIRFQHRLNDAQVSKDTVICPWCYYNYNNTPKFHDESGYIICEFCSRVFKLKKHIKMSYTSMRPHQ